MRNQLYLSHSKKYENYKNLLYLPLRNSSLSKKYTLILPHESDDGSYPTKKLFDEKKEQLIVLAEISCDATGSGIELGWADDRDIPIISFYMHGLKGSTSAKMLSKENFTYCNFKDIIPSLENILEKYQC